MFAAEFITTMMKIIKSSQGIALLLFLVSIMAISCSSKCECTLYENGAAVGSSTEVAQGQSCEEFSSVVETPYGKMGLECVKKNSFQSE